MPRDSARARSALRSATAPPFLHQARAAEGSSSSGSSTNCSFTGSDDETPAWSCSWAASSLESSTPTPSRNTFRDLVAGDTTMRQRPPIYDLVSVHHSVDDARIAMQMYDAYSYVHAGNNGSRGRVSKYSCVEHKNCKRMFRIRAFDSDTAVEYALELTGQHTREATGRTRTGIHPSFLAEVDAAATTGGTPTSILTTLTRRYESQPNMLLRLPTVEQIKNRKARLMTKLAQQTEIETFSGLCQWASLRMCNDVNTFFGDGTPGEFAVFDRGFDEAIFSAKPPGYRNATLVLKCFQHTYVEDGVSKSSFGLIFTNRRIFRNVLYAVQGQQSDGVFAAADGTYKLHYGNWVLVAFGTYRSRFTSSHVYSKNFQPWAYMFVRTENQHAYEMLFRTVAEFSEKLFGLPLVVRYGSLDHAACIANAYRAVWPDITLLDCYPHVARKCREKVGLLASALYFKNSIEGVIKHLHKARSTEHFNAIAALCLKRWRADGEKDYADWFESIYLDDTWSRWYATSATPGVVPSQNALESHNAIIKKCGITTKRAKTGVVLNDSIPGIFAVVALDAPMAPFGHYCEGPLPEAMVKRAEDHVARNGHFIKYHVVGRKRYIRSFFFNSTAYMPSPANPSGLTVTSDRVKTYAAAKDGKLRDGDTIEHIQLNYQSLHEVQLLDFDRAKNFQLKLEPIITIDKMKEIRSIYLCDCKAFLSTGWACSHVVATMALMKTFDLTVALSVLPTRKLSGGQRKIPGALYADDPNNRTLSKVTLMTRLLRQPAYAYRWCVGREFVFEDDGKQTSEFITGWIGGHVMVDGVYRWPVIYSDGDKLMYECEELVELIVSSRRIGLDVTGLSLGDQAESERV